MGNNYAILISALSLMLAFYTFLRKNTKDNTTELTTVIVKLENINSGISDIKNEISAMKNEQKEDHDRLVRIETSLQSAWDAIDDIKEAKEK